MAKLKLSERVDFTYFIGVGISLILFNITLFFHKDSGLPMIFALVSLCTYIGVLIRGIIDRDSWGKTQKQMKISAFVGFVSIFLIFSIECVLLITRSFELSKGDVKNFFIFGGIGVFVLFIVLYAVWFRKISYGKLSEP